MAGEIRIRNQSISASDGGIYITSSGDMQLYGNSLTLNSNSTISFAQDTSLVDSKTFGSPAYQSGFAGSGWRIDKGITETGKASATVDNLTVRGRMRIYELLINQIRATNGSVFISSTGKVSSSAYVGSGGSGHTTTFDSSSNATIGGWNTTSASNVNINDSEMVISGTFETADTSSWQGLGNHVLNRISTDSYWGASSAEITASAAGNSTTNKFTTSGSYLEISESKIYTLEFFAKSISGNTSLSVAFNGNVLPEQSHTLTTSWQKFTMNATASFTTSSNIGFYLGGTGTFRLDNISLTNGHHLSVLVWINPYIHRSTNEHILGYNIGGANSWTVSKTATSYRFEVKDIFSATASLCTYSTSSIPTRSWGHIGGTFDRITGTASLYWNGELVSTSGVSTLGKINTSSLNFGVSRATSIRYSGSIGEIQVIRDYVLTESEISSAYSSGYKTSYTTGSVTAWYQWYDSGSDSVAGGLNDLTKNGTPFTFTNPLLIKTDANTNHGFLENDLIRAQRFTGTGVYQSNLLVNTVTSLQSFTATLISGDYPQPGFEFIRLGNASDSTRMGSIYLTADDDNAPFIDVVDGISSFDLWNTNGPIKVRMGRLDGITSTVFGSLTGPGGAKNYGFWASGSAYLEGGINATYGKIGGFHIDSTLISSSNNALRLNSSTQAIYIKNGADITSAGIFLSGSGEFNLQRDTANYIRFSGTTFSIVSNNFELYSSTISASSAVGGRISLGATPPQSINSGTGILLSGSGQLLIGNASAYGLKFDGTSLTVSSSTFQLGTGTALISGSGTNIKISGSNVSITTPSFYLGSPAAHISGSGTNILISGSNIRISTDTFLFGNSGSSGNSYISGSGGELEISSSGFYLTAQGNATLSGSVIAQSGKIANWHILSNQLTSSNLSLSSSGIISSSDFILGDLTSVISPVFGNIQGSGIYSKNAYFDGNTQIAGTLTAGTTSSVLSNFYAGKIQVNFLPNSNLNTTASNGFSLGVSHANSGSIVNNSVINTPDNSVGSLLFASSSASSQQFLPCNYTSLPKIYNGDWIVWSYYAYTPNSNITLRQSIQAANPYFTIGTQDITLVQDKWTRYTLIARYTAQSASQFRVKLFDSGISIPTNTSIYFWGGQVEVYPSSSVEPTFASMYQKTDDIIKPRESNELLRNPNLDSLTDITAFQTTTSLDTTVYLQGNSSIKAVNHLNPSNFFGVLLKDINGLNTIVEMGKTYRTSIYTIISASSITTNSNNVRVLDVNPTIIYASLIPTEVISNSFGQWQKWEKEWTCNATSSFGPRLIIQWTTASGATTGTMWIDSASHKEVFNYGYGTYFNNGGVGGTIQNPKIAFIDEGIVVRSSNNGTASWSGNNTISIGYSSSQWGLIGKSDSTNVFELGSTNQIANWNFTETKLYNGTFGTNGITLSSSLPAIYAGAAVSKVSGIGVFISGSGDFRIGNPSSTYMQYDSNGIYVSSSNFFLGTSATYISGSGTKIKISGSNVSIQTSDFDLLASTISASSDKGGIISLGATPPQSINSGTGILLSGSGQILIGAASGFGLKFDGTNLNISSSAFFLGSSNAHISGAGTNIKISGSNIQLSTNTFILGNSGSAGSAYISGSGGRMEISSSAFYLNANGTASLSGSIIASSGEIARFKILNSSISSSGFIISASQYPYIGLYSSSVLQTKISVESGSILGETASLFSSSYLDNFNSLKIQNWSTSSAWTGSNIRVNTSGTFYGTVTQLNQIESSSYLLTRYFSSSIAYTLDIKYATSGSVAGYDAARLYIQILSGSKLYHEQRIPNSNQSMSMVLNGTASFKETSSFSTHSFDFSPQYNGQYTLKLVLKQTGLTTASAGGGGGPES